MGKKEKDEKHAGGRRWKDQHGRWKTTFKLDDRLLQKDLGDGKILYEDTEGLVNIEATKVLSEDEAHDLYEMMSHMRWEQKVIYSRRFKRF